MRLIITTFALLFLGALAHAQITIERQDYTLEVGAQNKSWTVDFSNATVPQDGEGVVWDFSGVALEESFLVNYEASSSPLFPESNITEPSFGSFLGGLAIQESTSYNLLSDTAYGNWGLIGERVDIPLAGLTGGATDTLKALEMVVQNEQPRNVIKFPLNYGDSWSHNSSYSIDYLVTVAAFNLQGGPAQQITDNYTLVGQPAPQLMLDAFGLEQGETEITTRYFIYAKGLPRSAANILVDSNGEVISFNVSDDIKQFVSSTSQAVAKPVAVKAFPNPVVAGAPLSVEMPATINNGVLELVDALGRQVAVWPVSGLQGQIVDYNLPNHLQAGLYMYRIIENNQEVRGIGKLHVVH